MSASTEIFQQLKTSGIQMSLTPLDVQIICEWAHGTHLDVGTLCGGSAWAASHTADKVFTVDTLNYPHLWEKEGYRRDSITFFQMPSAKLGKTWKEPLDSVFIDGSHVHEDVKLDIETWWPKLKPGGAMMFHDFSYSSPGVLQAVIEHILHGPEIDGGTLYWPPRSSTIVTIFKAKEVKNELS